MKSHGFFKNFYLLNIKRLWKKNIEHRPRFILGKPLSIFFEPKYVQQLTSKGSPHPYKFHGTPRFIDDLCTINNDCEFSSCKYIYPKQLELKLRTKREKFSFFIVCMPYLSSKIPSSIFCAWIFSEFLQIAWCTLRQTDFVPKTSPLYTTILDKIFGTNSSNPVKLDGKRKVWYLFLHVFQLLSGKSKFLKGG